MKQHLLLRYIINVIHVDSIEMAVARHIAFATKEFPNHGKNQLSSIKLKKRKNNAIKNDWSEKKFKFII